MVRELRDQIGKGIAALALGGRGEAELEKEVAAHVQAVDVWFTPHPGDGPPGASELLASLAPGPTLFELFSGPLREREVLGCLSKLLAVRAGLARQRRAGLARRVVPEQPRLVIVATTASRRTLARLGAPPESPGIFRLPPALATVIVAAHGVPREPSTLIVRLMGRGCVLRGALEDLDALPASEPLARPLRDLLVRWRVELMSAGMLTRDEEDFVMQTERYSDIWFRQVREQFKAEGREEGREEGQILAALRVLALRFGELPPALESRLLAISEADAASRLIDLAVQAPSLDAVVDALPPAADDGH